MNKTNKRYLNSDERFRIVTISSMIGQINDTIKTWENLKRSPLVLKYLKTSRTFAQKSLDELYKELTIEEQHRLWNYASQTKFGVMVGNVTNANTDKKTKVKYSTDNEELMKDIAEALIEQNCKNCKRNKGTCHIRQAMNSWEIPPYKEIIEEGECQYEY